MKKKSFEILRVVLQRSSSRSIIMFTLTTQKSRGEAGRLQACGRRYPIRTGTSTSSSSSNGAPQCIRSVSTPSFSAASMSLSYMKRGKSKVDVLMMVEFCRRVEVAQYHIAQIWILNNILIDIIHRQSPRDSFVRQSVECNGAGD